jgi:hypothetical protein
MGATDSERFDVYFRGECLDGAAEADVRAALGRLFRADGQTLDRLFSGDLQRIKRGVDHPTAEKYRTAMERAGARALIRPHAGGADPTAASTSEAARQDTAHAGDAAAGSQAGAPGPGSERVFDIAPLGSDVLRPEERRRHDTPAPATDHIDLAAVGETLGSATERAVPTVPTPDFDVAEVGTDLLDSAPLSPVAAPDVSAITLAAPEHDLSDCAPAAPDAPVPDIDHLAVAPPGGDLIDDNERKHRDTPAPRTDHLSLAEADGERGVGGAGNPFER